MQLITFLVLWDFVKPADGLITGSNVLRGCLLPKHIVMSDIEGNRQPYHFLLHLLILPCP